MVLDRAQGLTVRRWGTAYTETATASVVPVNGANALGGAQAPVVGAAVACAVGVAALL